jgi:hypothetical protein
VPAKAPPPVSMAAGMLFPAACDSRPATPAMIPAVSSMSTTHTQRGTLGRWGEAGGSVGIGGIDADLSIMATTKGVEATTLSIYSVSMNFHVHSQCANLLRCGFCQVAEW